MSETFENLRGWPVWKRVSAICTLLGIPGYPDAEIGLMVDTLEKFRPYWIFEWGTNRGSSARIFWEAARFIPLQVEIHTTELPDGIDYLEHPGEDCGLFVRGLERVTQHRGDGVETTLSLARLLPKRSTMFFIDGDHSAEVVQSELFEVGESYPGACILLHDTGHSVSGPREALESFLACVPRQYEVTRVETPVGMTRLMPR